MSSIQNRLPCMYPIHVAEVHVHPPEILSMHPLREGKIETDWRGGRLEAQWLIGVEAGYGVEAGLRLSG